MKPLYDLQQEINRLFIAGSKFAKGDPRIAKHISVLEKLGEKAPVFKKLAQDTDELTRTASEESADKLLGLGTLLYSVLYTQGKTVEEDAEIKPLEPSVSLNDVNTSASYLELSPIIEALTTTQSGRMNVVEEGFKRGVFNDFRTYEYVNRALGDKYAELADFIEQKIIPSAGIKMLPMLIATFSYDGRAEDIRRFRLLYAFKYPGLAEIVTKVLANSSSALQAEAVRVLSDDVANQSLVMSLVTDKHKPVREAAYRALAKYGTPESTAKLVEIFLKNKNKGNIDGIVEALKLLQGFSEEVFNKVYADFEACATLDKDVDEKTLKTRFEMLRTEMNAIYGKTDERILRFFEEVLSHQNFNAIISFRKTMLSGSGQAIGSDIAQNLSKLGQPGIETFERLAANDEVIKMWGTDIIPYYFSACAFVYTPEALYDAFATHYKNKRLGSYSIVSMYGEHQVFYHYFQWDRMIGQKFDDTRIDKRWIDLFLDRSAKDDAALYMAITCDPKNRKIKNIIGDRLDATLKNRKIPDDFLFFIEKAAEAEVPDFHNKVLKVFENGKNIASHGSVHYICQQLKESPVLKLFPKSCVVRFRMLATISKVDIFNEIADIIARNN